MTAPTPPWLESSPGPNGRPVRENFIDWFRGSVIAGADGIPLVLAHGTTQEFDVFEPSKGGAQGPGIYMAQVAPGAKAEYGDHTLELVVHMRNPFSWNASEKSYDAMVDGQLLEHVLGAKRATKVVARIDREGINAYGTELVTELRSHGHDGLVVVPPWSKGFLKGDNVVIAWEARQVKLAYGNSGIFSKRASLSDRPMSLGEQVRQAQAVVASWSPEKRASVQLEGGDFHTAPRRRARP